jgi:hypothetical protein
VATKRPQRKPTEQLLDINWTPSRCSASALKYDSSSGYTLCGLKAYVQFGINLRTGLNKRLTDVEKASGKRP